VSSSSGEACCELLYPVTLLLLLLYRFGTRTDKNSRRPTARGWLYVRLKSRYDGAARVWQSRTEHGRRVTNI